MCLSLDDIPTLLIIIIEVSMSFWSKFTENKLAVVAAAGAILGGAVFWYIFHLPRAYKQYEKESEDKVENGPDRDVAPVAPAKEFDLRAEINKLKAEINVGDPTFEDIKKIFRLITEYAKSKTFALSAKFKADRRKRFPKEVRYTRMPEYMRDTANGLMELQNVLLHLQNEQGQIMGAFGITQQSYAKYAAQLGSFMQELQVQELDLKGDISLENTRLYLHLKTEYLQTHGERLAEALLELASSLPLQEKQLVPIFLTTFIIDEVFENQPTLDREEFEIAAEHYKNALTPELISFEKAIMPLMGRLQTALAGDQMGGLGGFGGYGSYPEEYDNSMGPGFSQQAMEQQLEAIRQQDPQAYEQLMAMMQAQMGR